MASWKELLDEERRLSGQEDGVDASDPSDTEAIVPGNQDTKWKGLMDEERQAASKRIQDARQRAFRAGEQATAPFDVMGSIDDTKRQNAEPEASIERWAGAGKEGFKDQIRQWGIFTTYAAELSALRKMSDEYLAAERETPFSTFEAGVMERDAFIRTIPMKDRKEILSDPEKFAQARVDYIMKRNKSAVMNAQIVRNAFKEVYKQDPAYFQSSGFIEDVFRMGPQFATQIATSAVTGPVGGAVAIFGTIGGARLEKELAKGTDKETAMSLALLDGFLQAPLEQIGLGKAAALIKPQRLIAKKMKKVVEAQGTEFLTEYLQAYPSLAIDLVTEPNPEQLGKIERFLDIVAKDEFQKGALYEGSVAAVWSGVVSTAAVAGQQEVKDEPKTNASDLNKQRDVEAENVAPGRTVVKKTPETVTPDIRSESKADGNPTVEHLMAVDDRGEGVTVDDLVSPEQEKALEEGDMDHPSLQGRSLSDDLQSTPKQKATQLGTNDSIKSILEDVRLNKGLKKAESQIIATENEMDKAREAYTMFHDQDTQSALDAARRYQSLAQQQAEQLKTFAAQKQEFLMKDNGTMSQDEITGIEVYNQENLEDSAKVVQGLEKRVAFEEAQKLNQFRTSLEDPKQLRKALDMAVTQDKTRGSRKNTIYQAVQDMMDLRDYTTQESFLKEQSVKKLVKQKGDLERQMADDNLNPKITPEAKAVDQATVDFLEQTIQEKQAFDLEVDLAKNQDEIEAHREKIQRENEAKAQRLTSSDKKYQAKRAVEKGKVVTKTQERVKQVREAKAAKETAEKAKTVEKKRVEVQKQQAKTRKTPATPVSEDRKYEIQKARERAQIKKEQAKMARQLGDDAPKKATPLPDKAKTSDLKKKDTSWTIVTPDNPKSTTRPQMWNRRAQLRLAKKLTEKGIKYQIGRSKFEGMKEVPFIIEGLTKKQAKELSDELGQTSFIYAENENVDLVEGSKTRRVKKSDIRLTPDATDNYTQLQGEKFSIPFYTDKESLLNTESFQLSGDEVSVAKRAFKSAGIKFDGKVYEGSSHMDILMNNDTLAKEIENTPTWQMHSKFEHGFVTHSGQFVDRMSATKAMKLPDGHYLKSEDFLKPAMQVKAEQFDKAGMKVDNFENMKLKDQMGTLEMMDSLKEFMGKPKYKWLFDKTADLGVETHFITAKGQYRSVEAVKRAYPGMRELDDAVTRFEGDLRLDPATGWMIPTGGVRGVYLKMQPLKGNLAGQALINLPIIGEKSSKMADAEETLVHEHVHALVDHAQKNLSQKERAEVKKELEMLWDSIPESLKKEILADTKGSPRRLRAGIAQINRDGVGELITYSLAHPDFANWLNTLPASPRFKAKSSKIKSIWDALKNLVVTKVMKVPTKLDEVTDILDRHLDKSINENVRYSKESSLDFDFGANVSVDNVTEWNQELIDQANDIAESVVVQTVEEAEEILGKKITGKVPSIWTEQTRVKKKVYGIKGKTKEIVTVVPEKVIFIADNIESRDHFVKKWMHEQVTHHGLRATFGENTPLMNRFLDQAYGLFSIKDADVLNEIIELYDLGTVDKNGKRKLTTPQKRVAAEEVMALRSESLTQVTKKGLITRFKNFLKRWLPKKFVGVKNTFKMKDQDVWDLLEAVKAKVIMGDTKLSTMIVKSLEARGPKYAYKGWKTLPKFMEKDETYREWSLATVKANPNLRKWYDKHTAVIEKEFGDDADLFQVLLAITSPQTDVETNVQFAVDTYAYLLGHVDKPGGLFPNNLKEKKLDKWTSPEGLFRSLESGNFKVTEFGRALLGDEQATVGDIWMFRAFFGDHAYYKQGGETFSKPHVVAMRQKLHDLAAQLSEQTGETWAPREVQAAIWIHINSQSTGKDLTEVADYMSGLNRPSPKYDGKTPLEWIKTLQPGMNTGPLSKKLGVTKMPLAPKSPLAKQRIQQIRLEMKARGQKTKYDVNKSGHIAFIPVDEDTDIQNLMDALVDGGRTITPVDEAQADWLKENFGFEYQDDNTMVLSERAENLFKSKKTGKVSFGDIRNNLGGFSGAYTQEVRFAREARESVEDIGNMPVTDPAQNAEFIKTGNDGSSVVNMIHEKRDLSERRVDRFITGLEQKYLQAFGGRETIAGKTRMGTKRLMHTRKTEVLQRAMNLYIDSGTGANRAKVESYAAELRKKGGKLTVAEREQLEIMDRMLNMTAGEIGWVNENIRPYYEDFFKHAQANELVDSHRDNYVKRMWQMPKKYEDAGISWQGSNATTGFTLTPTFGKPRTFDSIVDGWKEGMTLLQGGVLNNLGSYAKEMGYVMANRQFVNYMRSLKTFTKGGLMHEYKGDSNIKPPEGYTKLTDRGFAKPGHVVYARTDLANMINKLSQKPSWALWNTPGIKLLRRINSSIKSTILSVSIFHHLAGFRSMIYGVAGKKKFSQWNPFTAYKRGLKELDAEQGTRLENPDYYHLGPVVDYLVQEGLTVGKTQDWEEVGGVGFMEEALEKGKGKLAYKAYRGLKGAQRWRQQMTTGLFNRLFAGLKAEAASIEFAYKIQKKEKKLGRSLNDQEIKLLAQQVAMLVNADFGGLHLSRMGRNPDLQRLAQMTLLAPDWTESNWRTFTGMIPGANKFINKMIGDNPEVEGMGKVYRGFWRGIAMRGITSLILAQAAVLGLFADEEEREEYYDFMLDNLTDPSKFSKGRWASVDLTPLTRDLGIGNPEKRQVFSILGHFKDVLKVGDPISLAKHKISPVMRTGETLFTGKDWKGTRFTTLSEMLESGSFTAENKYAKEVAGLTWYSTIPSLIGYNVRQSFPIFASNAMEYLQGESSALGSIARAGGFDLRDVGARSAGQRKYEEVRSDINALDNQLKEAKASKDRDLIRKAKQEIKEYPKFNQHKSRMNYARTQLSVINKKIKGLEAVENRTPKQEKELEKWKAKKEKVFEKFYQVINR